MDVVSRKEAKEQGLSRYFTGNPCPKSHIVERRVHNGQCIECMRISDSERNRRRRQEHPEIVAEWKRRDYQNHKEYNDKKNREWAQANPDKIKIKNKIWRDENRERFTAMVRDWRKRNPAAVRLQKYRRRMLEATASGEFTQHDLFQLLETQQGLCVGCKCDISVTFTVDHKTPLSRGGINDPQNLQLLCRACNSSKGTRTQQEWIIERAEPMRVICSTKPMHKSKKKAKQVDVSVSEALVADDTPTGPVVFSTTTHEAAEARDR